MTIWFINANVSVGSVQSDAIGQYRQEPDNDAGAAFHKLLLKWAMVLPATFHQDHRKAGTWTS